MSGGSFNYLCWANTNDEERLVNGSYDEELKSMANYLTRYDCPKAAADTLKILERVRAIRQEIAKIIPLELSDVFHAVEWKVSCDWSEEQMLKVLREYENARD